MRAAASRASSSPAAAPTASRPASSARPRRARRARPTGASAPAEPRRAAAPPRRPPRLAPVSTWAALRADFRANAPELADGAGPPALARALARHVPTVRFLAVLLLRAAQAAGAVARPLGALLKQSNHVLTGCDFAF